MAGVNLNECEYDLCANGDTVTPALAAERWPRRGAGGPPPAGDQSTLHLAFLSARLPEAAARRLLLVGTGGIAARACEAIRRAGGRCRIVGIIDSVPQPGWLSRLPDAPLAGGFDDVRAAVLERCVDEIHVALPARSCLDRFEGFVSTARELGVTVSFHLDIGGQADIVRVARAPGGAVASCPGHPSMTGFRRRIKRSIDVAVSAGLLCVAAPLFVVIAAVIKLTSPGPVFFRQPRIGFGRRQFHMLKFRTMLENAEALRAELQERNDARGISFKVFRDPRVTRIGALLRRTSLDELPQLVNVLRGDMSLVGPRPIPTWVAEQMRGSAYVRRFSVMQGLTGLWQVEGREQDFDRMAVRDLRYVDGWSLALDLRLLLRTLPAVLRGEGAH